MEGAPGSWRPSLPRRAGGDMGLTTSPRSSGGGGKKSDLELNKISGLPSSLAAKLNQLIRKIYFPHE